MVLDRRWIPFRLGARGAACTSFEPLLAKGDEGVHRLVDSGRVAGGEQVQQQAPGGGDAEPDIRGCQWLRRSPCHRDPDEGLNPVVDDPVEEVYDFLDVLSNHALFTDHMMRDWRYDGPARGVGAKATITAFAAGRTDTIHLEVIEAERPTRNAERNVGAAGRRVATGTYTLAEFPAGAPGSPSSTPGRRLP